MVKPEIMLCKTLLNLSTLNTLTYLLTYEMDQRIIDAAIRQWRARLRARIKAKGGHFGHTLSQCVLGLLANVTALTTRHNVLNFCHFVLVYSKAVQ